MSAWNPLVNTGFLSLNDYLLEQLGTTINHEEIASKLLKSFKSKEDAVIESIERYQMTDSPKYCMRFVRAHIGLYHN